MRLVVLFLAVISFAFAGPDSDNGKGYVGSDVCAGCHKSIAATQVHTAMSRTWQGTATHLLPPSDAEHHAEGPAPDIQYGIQRKGNNKFQLTIGMPNRQPLSFPIETTMGGTRHGLSFLFRVPDLEGVKLPRAPLVEARYLHYVPHDRLELSPGFPQGKPANYETALGRVLTPSFGAKCLLCHGEPRVHGVRTETGVGCESCHGPGQPHLLALSKGSPDKGILNPRTLPVKDQMKPCSQCHSGFSVVEDPLPDDLLISDQVTSLSNSECFRQSGGRITCTNCHNPHQDAPRSVLVARSEKTCLGCHSATGAKRPALCPVNRTSGCVGCHLPDTRERPPLVVSDHWIRVHPEQHVAVTHHSPAWRSQVTPLHEYLRTISVNDRDKADSLHQQLVAGSSFFDLARANSTERASAENGGYLGDLEGDRLPAAALALRPGELSQVTAINGKYVILQRMPRNFREDAETVFNKAMDQRSHGDRQQSAGTILEALKIYPELLRGLTYLGITYGEAGNPQTGAAILNIATRLYPQDAGAHFNLGIAYGVMGNPDEQAEYRRALQIDPDLVLAYLNLGASFYSKGQYDEAIDIYRKGVEVNPLIASLHYSLSLALTRKNKSQEAQQELTLAQKIDPTIGK
jgi:predicted CXXCH cytochrome family protein